MALPRSKLVAYAARLPRDAAPHQVLVALFQALTEEDREHAFALRRDLPHDEAIRIRGRLAQIADALQIIRALTHAVDGTPIPETTLPPVRHPNSK